MNKDKIYFSLMSDIDTKYVESASEFLESHPAKGPAGFAETEKSKASVWTKRIITSAAACFVIAFTVIMAVILSGSRNYNVIDPGTKELRVGTLFHGEYNGYANMWLDEKNGKFYMESYGTNGSVRGDGKFCGVGEMYTSYSGTYTASDDDPDIVTLNIEKVGFCVDLTEYALSDKKAYSGFMDDLDIDYAIGNMRVLWDTHTTPDENTEKTVRETLKEMINSLKDTGYWSKPDEAGYTDFVILSGNYFDKANVMPFDENRHATFERALEIIAENPDKTAYEMNSCFSSEFGTCNVSYPGFEGEYTFEYWLDAHGKERILILKSAGIILYSEYNEGKAEYSVTIYGEPETVSGKCGDNVAYTYDKSLNRLFISGTGAMWNFDETSPWNRDKAPVKKVIIGEGIVSIGNSSFDSCKNLKSITIPKGVTAIENKAFSKY